MAWCKNWGTAVYAGRCISSVFPYCLFSGSALPSDTRKILFFLLSYGSGLMLTPTSPFHPQRLWLSCAAKRLLHTALSPVSLCFSLVTTWRAQPWPLLLLESMSLPPGMACLMYSHLCSVGLVNLHLTMGPSQCFTDEEFLLPGASFAWCSWALTPWWGLLL